MAEGESTLYGITTTFMYFGGTSPPFVGTDWLGLYMWLNQELNKKENNATAEIAVDRIEKTVNILS